MQILQQPFALNLSGNLPDLLVSSQDPIDFSLTRDGSVLLVETYYPDANGEILIELKDLIEGLLVISIPALSSEVVYQVHGVADFTAVLEVIDTAEEETFTFRVIKGGVDFEDQSATQFLTENFLTWQPQQKNVKLSDPEFISYYAISESIVKCKGYFSGAPVITDLLLLPADKLATINVKYSLLVSKFSDIPKYVDIWIEQNAAAVSFVQRYILNSDEHQYDDIYVFENTLGGIDTIRFTGELEKSEEYKFENALFKRQTIDYYVEPNPVFTKNSGIFRSERERQWSLEFFGSLQKFHLSNSQLKQIRVLKHSLDSVKGNLATYDFDFTWTEQTKYRNLNRVQALPELEVPGEDPPPVGSGGIVKIKDQNDNVLQTVTAPGEFKVLAFTGIKVTRTMDNNLSIIVNPEQ